MKLSYKKTIYVGLAFFIISIFWQTYDTIVPKILVDKFGMNQSLSGFIMALDNILALFLLPLFGNLSDKKGCKMGRRKPYVLIGTLLAAVFFITSSFADNAQLVRISGIENNQTVYDSGVLDQPTLKIDGVQIRQAMTEEGLDDNDFITLSQTEQPQLYDKFVKPAQNAYAWQITAQSPATLIAFVLLLLFLLLSMSVFRSPAVALMPDVTVKPLRSKANAVINLMGSAGGIAALVLGILFKTGAHTYMSYTLFFTAITVIMLLALLLFMLKVDEPRWAKQMEEDSNKIEEESQKTAQTPFKAAAQKDGADMLQNKAAVLTDDTAAVDITIDTATYKAMDKTTDRTIDKATDKAADTEEEGGSAAKARTADKPLGSGEMRSLLLLLASVFLWFTGYNAVTSKFSVYAGNVLSLDYNTPLIIAQAAAIISFIPIGNIASKVGRRKTVLAGILMLTAAFFLANFITRDSGKVMYALFAFAGVAWATINVNSFPMVVELARSGNVGKYTGFYYTASMAAQILTPILSGVLMDLWGYKVLFPYAAAFAALSFVTMLLTRHGDSAPQKPKGLEAYSD